MCIRDRPRISTCANSSRSTRIEESSPDGPPIPVSYTHLRAHETRHDLVCRLLLVMKRRPLRRTQSRSSTASDVYKRQAENLYLRNQLAFYKDRRIKPRRTSY